MDELNLLIKNQKWTVFGGYQGMCKMTPRTGLEPPSRVQRAQDELRGV